MKDYVPVIKNNEIAINESEEFWAIEKDSMQCYINISNAKLFINIVLNHDFKFPVEDPPTADIAMFTFEGTPIKFKLFYPQIHVYVCESEELEEYKLVKSLYIGYFHHSSSERII
jgi:hypothetical protein